MDIATTLIGLVLLGLFILPVVLIMRSARNRGKRLLNELHSEASGNHLVISRSDSWNNSAIGIDEESGKIINIDENGSGMTVNIFNISDIKSVRTIPDIINNRGKKEDSENERTYRLIISLKNSMKKEIQIPYTSDSGKFNEPDYDKFSKWAELLLKYSEG